MVTAANLTRVWPSLASDIGPWWQMATPAGASSSVTITVSPKPPRATSRISAPTSRPGKTVPVTAAASATARSTSSPGPETTRSPSGGRWATTALDMMAVIRCMRKP